MFHVRTPARAKLSARRSSSRRTAAFAFLFALLPASFAATGQAAPAPQTPPAASTAQTAPTTAEPSSQPAGLSSPPAQGFTAQEKAAGAARPEAMTGAITEDELKQMLVGKALYLRGGYLGDSLAFNEHGGISGHPTLGSYTLSMIQIDKVRLAKHKVELDGIRYGLHFNEQLAYEDSSTAYDKVRITPRKKIVKITIDRELVVKPKKVKVEKAAKGAKAKAGPTAAKSSTQSDDRAPAATLPASAASVESTGPTDEQEAKAEMATASEEERPVDPNSITTTLSPAHAAKVLKDALDKIFAPGLDDSMKAAMPDFWKLYYQAAAAKTDYRPTDPSVMRQSAVDKKARLISNFAPDSNQFAQDNGIAGMALYHVVVGPDGKPGEIAVARPIGFGLDENAVAAIRKAQFDPAMKDGKPVPVLLDLVVQFRIYSKRTDIVAPPETDAKPTGPVLPGPYSVHTPQ